MRDDMFEIIIERPRSGSRMGLLRRNNRFDGKVASRRDPDALAFRIGMRRAAVEGRSRKMLNENLAPLRRYLESQVNRPWDKVWSDICANLKATSTVQQHVRDHVADFVAVRTFNQDGTLWVVERGDYPRRLSESRYWLYVDQRTGLLRRNKHYKSWKQSRRDIETSAAKERAARMRELGPDVQAHRLNDGIWWEVSLAPIPVETMTVTRDGRPHQRARPLPYRDVVRTAGMTILPAAELYGRPGVYAVAKRQLSRKEMAALALPR
jgi:hypothetical protein